MGIRTAIVSLLAAGALLLTGCTSTASGESTSSASNGAESLGAIEQVKALGFDIADPKALIDGLDALPLPERPVELIASVRPNELVLQPGGPDELIVPTSELDFYLSIAPYVTQTHDCGFHSLTTCVGEQQNLPIEIVVTDKATGEEVLAENTATASNGFVGVWLPRDRELIVKIESEHGTAEHAIKTGENDLTCLTTMRFQA